VHAPRAALSQRAGTPERPLVSGGPLVADKDQDRSAEQTMAPTVLTSPRARPASMLCKTGARPAHIAHAICFVVTIAMAQAKNEHVHSVGIDLGTTLTVAARYYMVGEGTQGEVFINDQGERLTPSVAHFESGPDGEILVGHAAKHLQVKDPGSTVYGVKRWLGKDYSAVSELTRDMTFHAECDNPNQTMWGSWLGIDDKHRSVSPCPSLEPQHFETQIKRVAHSSYRFDRFHNDTFGGVCVWQWNSWWPVELISALVLKEVKQSAERTVGAPVHKAVVTIPAYFREPQRKATRVAAQIAGFEVLRLLAEPTAAAISYARNKKTDFTASESLLVFDLGGGTFDVSVLKYEGMGEFKVLAVTGDAFLGGEDLDVKIAKWLLGEFAGQYGDVSEEKHTKLYPRFVRAGRQAKEKLSYKLSVDVIVEGVGPGGDDFLVKMSRAKFERLNAEFFERLMPIVREGVRVAGLRTQDIDRVLMVGGSSRIPKVRELLKSEFGSEPEQILNPDEAIADGAAVLAFQLANPLVLTKKDDSFISFMHDAWASMTGTPVVVSQDSHEIAVKDVAAHSLGVSYWAGDCTVSQIKGNDQLAERLIREGAQSGEITVSLMWDDVSDLDLHVVTPGGGRIYFGAKRGSCGGTLDVDMNVNSLTASTKPVENVFWEKAPTGSYTVEVVMFTNRNTGGTSSRFSGQVEVNGVVTKFAGTIRENKARVVVSNFNFNGAKARGLARTACERKMKIIVPKNSALPVHAQPQAFVVRPYTACSSPFCVALPRSSPFCGTSIYRRLLWYVHIPHVPC
jgi:molecular chaperone DnaK (HSP70)